MKVDERWPVQLVIERNDEDWWSVHVVGVEGGDSACVMARSLRAALVGVAAIVALEVAP